MEMKMLRLILVFTIAPCFIRAETCGEAIGCKDPVSPAPFHVSYCPMSFSGSGTIQLDSINVSFTSPLDYNKLDVFVIVYYEGLPNPLFAQEKMFTCEQVDAAWPPLSSQIKCPGRKGDSIAVFTKQIDPIKFQPTPGKYTIHIEMSNEHKQLMTCFEVKLTVDDNESSGKGEQKARDDKLTVGYQRSRGVGMRQSDNSGSDSVLHKPVQVDVVP